MIYMTLISGIKNLKFIRRVYSIIEHIMSWGLQKFENQLFNSNRQEMSHETSANTAFIH